MIRDNVESEKRWAWNMKYSQCAKNDITFGATSANETKERLKDVEMSCESF